MFVEKACKIKFLTLLKRDKNWLIFITVSIIIDILILTRVGLDKGFTEKGILMSILIPINYWLAGIISFVIIMGTAIGLSYLNKRWALIIWSIMIYSNSLINAYGIGLYLTHKVMPW